jgi:hypothetical protein
MIIQVLLSMIKKKCSAYNGFGRGYLIGLGNNLRKILCCIRPFTKPAYPLRKGTFGLCLVAMPSRVKSRKKLEVRYSLVYKNFIHGCRKNIKETHRWLP